MWISWRNSPYTRDFGGRFGQEPDQLSMPFRAGAEVGSGPVCSSAGGFRAAGG
jgi:hypothetical protein